MTYGGTPINRQADRLWTHKSRKQHGRKQQAMTVKESAQIRRVCPICGKRKLGLEAHMAAKHEGDTISTPTDQSVNIISGRSKPAGKLSTEARQSDVTPARLEVRNAAAPIASKRASTKRPLKRRGCPNCGALFTQLQRHLPQAQGKVLAECPWCFSEVILQSGGKRRCGECLKLFTVGTKGEAVGIRPNCPECCDDFYTEKLGFLKCPRCGARNCFNGSGETC